PPRPPRDPSVKHALYAHRRSRSEPRTGGAASSIDCLKLGAGFRALPLLRLLPPRLQLAISGRPAFADALRAALDRHRIVGHVAGDHRAGANIGAAADLHRRDQRGVGADKGAGADDGLVLGKTVIVAGDG